MARRKHKLGLKRVGVHAKKRRKSVSASRAHPRARTRQRKGRKAAPKHRSRPRPVRRCPSKRISSKVDLRIEAAVRAMNRGQSLAAAARHSRIPRKQLQKVLTQKRLAKRKGQRWVAKDNRLRRVPVMTGGRFRVLTVRGYKQARLVGEHHHAVGQFVRTNAVKVVKPFKGRTVQAVSGRRYVLETDPNALHRIAAMDSPPFHEIYEITSNT